MKKSFIYFTISASLLIQACSTQVYNNKSYVNQHDLTGKTLAVLPVSVELTGRLPKDYSLEKKMALEEAESKEIQTLIYSQYLFKSDKRHKSRKAVKLINVEQVNSRLRSLGIDVRQSWSMNPDSLGKLIGADLVLKVDVKKDRIMSDAASFGIDVASGVIDKLLNKKNDNSSSVNTNGISKTYNLNLNATLSDVNSNAVITKFSRQGGADWQNTPEEVVNSTGKKIVRKGVIYAQ